MDDPFAPEFWRAHIGLFLTTAAVVGLVVGSFLNVVTLRLPRMMERTWRRDYQQMLESDLAAQIPSNDSLNLISPPSTCPQCGHRIRPWENIPVISYLLLRGRCAKCRKTISIRYPIVELLSAMLSIPVAYVFGASLTTLAVLIFTWSLVALAVIDIDHQLLPDDITLPLLWLGLLANSQALIVPLEQALLGAIGGYLSLWSVFWGFKLLTGKEGMGYGDFKLLAALGAWLGWKALPLVIILSYFVGAAVGIGLILLRGRDRNIPIPFGPYLATAGWIAMLCGDRILAAYLGYTLN